MFFCQRDPHRHLKQLVAQAAAQVHTQRFFVLLGRRHLGITRRANKSTRRQRSSGTIFLSQ